MNSNPINATQDLVRKLLIYSKNKRLNEAEKLAISIMQKFPTSQFGWKALWAALQKNGKIRESLSAIRKSVQLSSKDTKEHHSLGITLQRLERFKEAVASFTKALVLKPDCYVASFKLGAILQVLKRFEEAQQFDMIKLKKQKKLEKNTL